MDLPQVSVLGGQLKVSMSGVCSIRKRCSTDVPLDNLGCRTLLSTKVWLLV